ncbi:MAG: helix-turn-helix domain-containing protein [Lachnospiraceae bacterium]|nr:helix-turn-helix domain-containing protein [Lachnospiraceae bacterium]
MERMNRKFRSLNGKNRVLRQFLITYVIVFIVPLLICSIYFFQVIRMLGKDDLNFRQAELEHAADQIDNMLEEFENMGDILTANAYVNAFKHRTEDVWSSPNSYRLNELRDSLPQILLMNQNVFHYFIFFDKSNLVINDRDIYTWEDFFDLYLRVDQDITYEQWRETMTETPMTYGVTPETTYIYRNKQKKELLCYSRPLMTEDGANNAGIWILFDKETVLDRMPIMEPGCVQFIRNKSGELIYYMAGEGMEQDQQEILQLAAQTSSDEAGQTTGLSIGGEKYYLMQAVSSNSGFTCYVLHPDSTVRQRMTSILFVAVVIILFSIAAGFWLSYLMSKKTVVPINDILSEISRVMEKNETHQSVFDSLKMNFSLLVKRNTDLSAMIEDQRPYLRNAFVNRLLLGDIYTLEEAMKRADDVGLEYRDRSFLLLLFSFEMDWEEMEPELVTTCILSLTEAMDQELPGNFHAGLGTNQVVLLMSLKPDEVDAFRRQMEAHVEHIKELIPSSISEHLFVYGSNLAESLMDLNEVYRESVCMPRYGMDSGENMIYWYSQRPDRMIVYPSGALESKLVSCVFTGDQQGLHDELELLMKNWVLGSSMSAYLQQMLFGELQLILIRILDKLDAAQTELRPFYERLEKNMGLPLINQIPITLNLYRDICSFVQDRKQVQDSDSLMADVTAYIDMNYGDCCLSLAQVASMYSVSESSLSTMFKNTRGIKFSSYVEGVRISRAKELLETTSLTVSEISERVGYTSSNSFCRAFRRVTGINTSEFRKK